MCASKQQQQQLKSITDGQIDRETDDASL